MSRIAIVAWIAASSAGCRTSARAAPAEPLSNHVPVVHGRHDDTNWPLEIHLGDSLADVQRELGTTEPPELSSSSYKGLTTHAMYWIKPRGLYVFLTADIVDEIRFEAPFADAVDRVRLGDPEAVIAQTHSPVLNTWADGPFETNGKSYEFPASFGMVRYDCDANHVVVNIFVFSK